MEGIADYEFIRPLGEGNHGSFFLAAKPPRLPIHAQHVAVKVLAGRATDEVFRRATKELRAFAAVRSPYLVSLYDAGQQEGVFYYAMEYCPLGSLAVPARPLSRAEVLRAVEHAALAVHALHEAGMVHRDIKPANVLLHESGAKLSDLGLAQLLQPGLTMSAMGPVGSVEFMDPALLKGGRPSRASDIWSLGATLHRGLTGSGLYGELAGGDALLALRKVLSSEPALDPSLDASAAALVSRCLSADPDERPESAAEVAAEIAALAGHEPPPRPA